jgi:hypothetical protein
MSFNKLQTPVSTNPLLIFYLFFVFAYFSFYTTTYFKPLSFFLLSFFFKISYFIINLSIPFFLSLLLPSYSRRPGSTLALVHLLLLGCYILILLGWWLVPWKMICFVSLRAVLPELFPLRPEITKRSLVIRTSLLYRSTKSAVILSRGT